MRFNRPLYFYGIGGFVILFFGILIILSLNMTVFESNLYYQAIGWAIIAIGIILILSGIMTDTLNRFNK
jgi:tetrahydromethanopterin S-methyltransferase subunit E